MESDVAVTIHDCRECDATCFRCGLHFFQQRLKPRLDANLLAGFVSPRRANTQRCTEFITCTLGDMLPNHLENNLSSRTLIRIMRPVFLVIRDRKSTRLTSSNLATPCPLFSWKKTIFRNMRVTA